VGDVGAEEDEGARADDGDDHVGLARELYFGFGFGVFFFPFGVSRAKAVSKK